MDTQDFESTINLTREITIVLGDKLKSVSFIQDGNTVDARLVLSALVAGSMRISHYRRHNEPETSTDPRYITGETWRVVPSI
jgi:hypothetical protein